MQKFFIIGLGRFGRRRLEELRNPGVEILINENKAKAASAYIADIHDSDALRRLIPEEIDAAIEEERVTPTVVRNGDGGYILLEPENRLEARDILLMAGKAEDLNRISGIHTGKKKRLAPFFTKILQN